MSNGGEESADQRRSLSVRLSWSRKRPVAGRSARLADGSSKPVPQLGPESSSQPRIALASFENGGLIRDGRLAYSSAR